MCWSMGMIIQPVGDEVIGMVFKPLQGLGIEPLIPHAAVPLDADGEAVMLGINHNSTGIAWGDA